VKTDMILDMVTNICSLLEMLCNLNFGVWSDLPFWDLQGQHYSYK